MPLKKKKEVLSKKRKKKTVKKAPQSKVRPQKKQQKKQKNIIGVVTHYFPHVMAAVVKLKIPLSLGDSVRIKGHTTDFTQQVTSLQLEHVPINTAKKGQEIGLLVTSRVRQHDTIYKV